MNPYRLELVLSRLHAWTMYLICIAYAIVWVVHELPEPVYKQRWLLAGILTVVTIIAVDHESTVEEQALAFERERLGTEAPSAD